MIGQVPCTMYRGTFYSVQAYDSRTTLEDHKKRKLDWTKLE